MVAGNGGTMAEIRQVRNDRKKAAKQTGSGANAAAKAASPDAETNGAERLKRAADRLLEQKCEELSGLICEKAEKGSLGHMKLLYTLAEKKKPREKPVKKPRRMTLAMRLAAEPEWDREQGTVNREQGTVNSEQ
jgi:hypothetical protein